MARFAALPASVANARDFVTRRLTARNCPTSTVVAARLMVSELTTNVLLHARTPFSVELKDQPGQVTVEVSDIGKGCAAIRVSEDRRGMGLRIVAVMSDEWGVRSELMGKTVFFRLTC